MFRAFASWLEHRTRLSKLASALTLEHIPGGAKWRYVWGSCLSFVFAIQLITGVLLMTAYSAGTSSAWGSVFFIQYEMDFGWLIRGLHHFGSQTMVVLLFLHMLQVVIAGAHLPPREVNWWLGLILMGLVLGLSLTGYLLPWDQKGFWATQVATKIASGVPLIGPWLQKIIVGGSEYGDATLTRFFALHVGILPGLLIITLIAHIALFRVRGVTYAGYPNKPDHGSWFWPEQAFRDMVVCLIIFGVMLFLVFNGHGHSVDGDGRGAVHAAAQDKNKEEPGFYEYWAKAGQRGLGANLDAPADSSVQYDPRPEWYFLFLFQLLKYFEGDQVVIGTVVIPGAVTLVLFILPFLGYGSFRWFGRIVGVLVVLGMITAIASLTCWALAQDAADPIAHVLLNRIGTYVMPVIAVILLLHLTFTGLLRPGGARAAVGFVGTIVLTALLCLTGGLIYISLNPDEMPERLAELVETQMKEKELATDDSKEEFEAALEVAEHYQEKVHEANKHAARAIQLAHPGNIPALGGKYLLRNDPLTQFQPLFLKNCATCHSYADETVIDFAKIPDAKPLFKVRQLKDYKQAKFSASDLYGFGTEEWINSFLLDPGAKRFYGRIVDNQNYPWFTRMDSFVKKKFKRADGDKEVAEIKADFAKIAAWLATHPTGTEFKDAALNEGFTLFHDKHGCTSCHRYEKIGGETAPDLTGYGSQMWLHKMIRSPGHPLLYGDSNILEENEKGKDGKDVLDKEGTPKKVKRTLMPSFFPKDTTNAELQRKNYKLLLELARKNQLLLEGGEGSTEVILDFADLNDIDRELIVRYLTGDYRVVFGGREITGVDRKKKDQK